MINKNKKSQAALEFLTTYGWAILIVTIMIGALAYFGVINPKSVVKEQCITSGYPFECVDYSLDTTGRFEFIIRNMGDNYITVSSKGDCRDVEKNKEVGYTIASNNGFDFIPLQPEESIEIVCNFNYDLSIGDVKKIVVNVIYYKGMYSDSNPPSSDAQPHLQQFEIITKASK